MFLTEFFSRPTPNEIRSREKTVRWLESLCAADRFDADRQPADFPRAVRSGRTR